MTLSRIEANDFKSFTSLDLHLQPFNVLVGANASGKSNLVQLLAFLRNIANSGLENAISLQGGIAYLRNIINPSSRPFSISISSDQPDSIASPDQNSLSDRYIGTFISSQRYEFSLRTNRKQNKYAIVSDQLLQEVEFWSFTGEGEDADDVRVIARGTICIKRQDGKYSVQFPKNCPVSPADISRYRIIQDTDAVNDLLLAHPARQLLASNLLETVADLVIYDFDPKAAQKGIPLTGPAALEGDASNLAIVLREVLRDPENSRRLGQLMRDVLPFVSQLDVESFADRSLLWGIREAYADGKYIPASLLSDGTVHITALLVALYFQQYPLAIFEEPERNIHPYLIDRVLAMMKDVSSSKQIIITTQSTEGVRHVDPDDLFLVSRDKSGQSTVSKPIDQEEVRVFLDHEMGMADLFTSNMLRA